MMRLVVCRIALLSALAAASLLAGSPALALQGSVQLVSLTLSPASVPADATQVTGTVTLSAPATSPVSVKLISITPKVASAPASVQVAAGEKSATFPVTVGAPPATTTATIQATYNNVARSARLTVQGTPAPRVRSVTATPKNVPAGGTVTATVTLTVPAPAAGQTVGIAYGPSKVLTGPAPIRVPAGQTTVSVQVTAGSPSVATTGLIRAFIGPDGMTTTVTVGAAPGSSTLSEVVAKPDRLRAGESTSLSVRLAGPAPAGGVDVRLVCSDTGALRVPATARVPAGQAQVLVSAQAQSVASDRTVQVTATANGVSKSARVVVLGPTRPKAAHAPAGSSPARRRA